MKPLSHYLTLINLLDIGVSKKCAMREATRRLYHNNVEPNIDELKLKSKIELKRINNDQG